MLKNFVGQTLARGQGRAWHPQTQIGTQQISPKPVDNGRRFKLENGTPATVANSHFLQTGKKFLLKTGRTVVGDKVPQCSNDSNPHNLLLQVFRSLQVENGRNQAVLEINWLCHCCSRTRSDRPPVAPVAGVKEQNGTNGRLMARAGFYAVNAVMTQVWQKTNTRTCKKYLSFFGTHSFW